MHCEIVKWIFRYLKDIVDACLEFRRRGRKMAGYVDLDFVVDLDKDKF